MINLSYPFQLNLEFYEILLCLRKDFREAVTENLSSLAKWSFLAFRKKLTQEFGCF